jgi:hypothetical protein
MAKIVKSRKSKPIVGDIFEFRTSKGYSYLQYMFFHERLSHWIRVFRGFYDRPQTDFKSVFAAGIQYQSYLVLDFCIKIKFCKHVGHAELSEQEQQPPLMTMPWLPGIKGKPEWLIIEGEHRTKVDHLTEEQKSWPIQRLLNHLGLIKDTETCWTPQVDHEEYLASKIAGNARFGALPKGNVESLGTRIQFYLYFPTQALAKTAARDLSEAQITNIKIEQSDYDDNWLVTVIHEVVPHNINKFSRTFESVAKKNKGEYDGWVMLDGVS